MRRSQRRCDGREVLRSREPPWEREAIYLAVRSTTYKYLNSETSSSERRYLRGQSDRPAFRRASRSTAFGDDRRSGFGGGVVRRSGTPRAASAAISGGSRRLRPSARPHTDQAERSSSSARVIELG